MLDKKEEGYVPLNGVANVDELDNNAQKTIVTKIALYKKVQSA